MKSRVFGIGLFVVLALGAAAQTRTLTLQSGAVVEGDVIRIGPDAVTVRKSSDQKVYTVPLAYLSESNRFELLAERAKQWQPIEIIRLDGSASAGRYKRCVVRGTNISEVILVQMLPSSVESILNSRNQRVAEIADLSNRIEDRDWAVQRADAATPSTAMGDPDYVNAVLAQRAKVNVAIVDLNQAKSNLAKMQEAYAQYLDSTRADTILQMKNTGLVYQGLQVWDLYDPRKAQ